MERGKINICKYRYPKIILTSFYLSLILVISSAEADDKTEKVIGEASTDDVSHDLSRLFLRDSEVLLNPREIQMSIGFNYTTNETQRSFRKNRSRSISIPLNVSYGLTRRLEVNASVPFIYNENEVLSDTNVSDDSKSGIGDLSLGLSEVDPNFQTAA
ncbi:MAG: hypothetical protein KZQ95_20790 [Candidatus Thiodiazotropha sp. (ex Epidulcina cf. delphinae)]|nr:hypothetical protein [Candidatus Thiodiazotropha sp. (ex Epidulcina cf. delphinae)]